MEIHLNFRATIVYRTYWWFIQVLVFSLSSHLRCRYSPQPRLCDTYIKIICIVCSINFFFWWECSGVIDHKMTSYCATHASSVSSLTQQTRVCFCKIIKYVVKYHCKIHFPTINSEFYGRFFSLFVDRPDGFWMIGITFMF